MKLRLLLFYLLFNSTHSTAQIDSMLINEAWNIVHLKENKSLQLDSFNLKLDSIYVLVKYNSSKIITYNFFKKTSRSILIEYYFEDDSIRYITTSERNYTRPEMDYFSHYYLKRDTLVKDEHGSTRTNVQGTGIYTLDEITKIHFYANRIDIAFLNKYVFILLNILKEEIKTKKK